MPVDHEHNKHATKVKTFNLDLNKCDSWITLEHVVQNCNVIGVHIAPPCGTCSRAREIQFSAFWHGPQPLRSTSHPYGVPTVSQKNRNRVEQANAFTCIWPIFAVFSMQCKYHGRLRTPQTAMSYFTSFHSCAYGGKRYKATSFLTNHPAFLTFCRECEGSHNHLPWGFDRNQAIFNFVGSK